MTDIERASLAQEWLMGYYKAWIPLDKCLELVKFMTEETASSSVDKKHYDVECSDGYCRVIL